VVGSAVGETVVSRGRVWQLMSIVAMSDCDATKPFQVVAAGGKGQLASPSPDCANKTIPPGISSSARNSQVPNMA